MLKAGCLSYSNTNYAYWQGTLHQGNSRKRVSLSPQGLLVIDFKGLIFTLFRRFSEFLSHIIFFFSTGQQSSLQNVCRWKNWKELLLKAGEEKRNTCFLQGHNKFRFGIFKSSPETEVRQTCGINKNRVRQTSGRTKALKGTIIITSSQLQCFPHARRCNTARGGCVLLRSALAF